MSTRDRVGALLLSTGITLGTIALAVPTTPLGFPAGACIGLALTITGR